MAEGIQFAHQAWSKGLYVTANILAHNRDLDEAREYFKELKRNLTGCTGSFEIQGCP